MSKRKLQDGKRYLTPNITRNGSHRVRLYHDGKIYPLYVHDLVAEAFIPNKDMTAKIVRHVNGDKSDNRVSNLHWVNPDPMSEKMNIVFYETEDTREVVTVHYENETFWLNQDEMSELYEKDQSVISRHISNILKEGELNNDSKYTLNDSVDSLNASVMSDQHNKKITVLSDGRDYNIEYYNLDMIIAVGYRVNSKKATHFRQWATKMLNQLITKGYVINEKLLEVGGEFADEYFNELLRKLGNVRYSERYSYSKILSIIKNTSYDYNRDIEHTNLVLKHIQNSFHIAITGKTAAELIITRADERHPTNGLTVWRDLSEIDKVYEDMLIGKNYLSEIELVWMNNLVGLFLNIAEKKAKEQIKMSIADWEQEIDTFLNEYIANREMDDEVYIHIQVVSIVNDIIKNKFIQYGNSKGYLNGNKLIDYIRR